MCQTLGSIGEEGYLNNDGEGKHLVLSVIFCLAEWVMKMPQAILIQPGHDRLPILHSVFKVTLIFNINNIVFNNVDSNLRINLVLKILENYIRLFMNLEFIDVIYNMYLNF